VPEEILKEVDIIIDALLERNYVKANDAYYRLAIGNAPWPMGVTMVGIHERSAREKISSSAVARTSSPILLHKTCLTSCTVTHRHS